MGYTVFISIMENRMEKSVENDMETGLIYRQGIMGIDIFHVTGMGPYQREYVRSYAPKGPLLMVP